MNADKPIERKTNALAELAKEMQSIINALEIDNFSTVGINNLCKAQRIIAELAKVEVCKGADNFMPLDKPYDGVTVYAESESDYGGNDFSDKDSDCILDLANAAWNCRAIAEEGDGDGK